MAAMISDDFVSATLQRQKAGGDNFYLTDYTQKEMWRLDPKTLEYIKYDSDGNEDLRVPTTDGTYEGIQGALYTQNILKDPDFDWQEQTLVQRDTPSVNQLTSGSNKSQSEMMMMARQKAQKKDTNVTLGALTAIQLAGLAFDARAPKYIRDLKKDVKEGVDEEEIEKKVQEVEQETLRSTRAAARDTQRTLERIQASGMGNVTSAGDALRGAKAATQATIEALSGLPMAKGQYREQLLTEAQATVDDARQAVFLDTMARRDKRVAATNSLSLALMRVKGPSFVTADTGSLNKMLEVRPAGTSDDALLKVWSYVFDPAFDIGDREKRLNEAYEKHIGGVPTEEFTQALLGG